MCHESQASLHPGQGGYDKVLIETVFSPEPCWWAERIPLHWMSWRSHNSRSLRAQTTPVTRLSAGQSHCWLYLGGVLRVPRLGWNIKPSHPPGQVQLMIIFYYLWTMKPVSPVQHLVSHSTRSQRSEAGQRSQSWQWRKKCQDADHCLRCDEWSELSCRS